MAKRPERLHALDALRGIALMLGVLLHISMSFIPGDVFWFVNDHDPSYTMSAAYFTIHTFRMVLFFFIAGFFAQLSLERLGPASYVRDRIKRIALPLLVGWIVLFPIMMLTYQWGMVRSYGPEILSTSLANPPIFGFRTVPMAHFWFLYLLSVFYGGAMIMHRFIGTIDRRGLLGRMGDRITAMLVKGPFAVIVLSVPAFVGFMTIPGWTGWVGIPAPDHGLVPNHTAILAYGVAFSFGWFVRRQVDLINVWRKHAGVNLVVAIALTTGLIIFNGLSFGAAPPSNLVIKTINAAAYAMAGWAWTFAMVGLALRFLSGYSAVARYLADASYWIYLIHMPIVVVLQGWVSTMDLHWMTKFVIIVGVSMPVMLASYHLLVRRTIIGEILNGKRAPRPTLALDPARAFTSNPPHGQA